MKSILMSIKPKWVEKIASGEKTVEVRKTVPKCGTPFKVYMYETPGATETPFADEDGHLIFKGRGRVVGEFVCDKLKEYNPLGLRGYELLSATFQEMCLSKKELDNYGGLKSLFGLHISDLKIYDKPKELSEFRHFVKCNSCKSGYEAAACLYDEKCLVPARLTRPPQSWQFVEEL